MREDILLKMRPMLESHLERGGYVLVDTRFYKNQLGALILEVLADRAEGGITLDECTALNRQISDILETSGLLDFRYTLDVSSPGLDRPLMVAADFRRALGCEIRIFLREALEGRIEYCGILESVADEGIYVKTNQKSVMIPIEKVNKAKRVIP